MNWTWQDQPTSLPQIRWPWHKHLNSTFSQTKVTAWNKWIRWDKRFKHCFLHNLQASWDYQTGNLTGGQDASYQLLIYSGLCLRAGISNYTLSGLESQGADEDHSRTRASLKNISLSLNSEDAQQRGKYTVFYFHIVSQFICIFVQLSMYTQ